MPKKDKEKKSKKHKHKKPKAINNQPATPTQPVQTHALAITGPTEHSVKIKHHIPNALAVYGRLSVVFKAGDENQNQLVVMDAVTGRRLMTVEVGIEVRELVNEIGSWILKLARLLGDCTHPNQMSATAQVKFRNIKNAIQTIAIAML